MMRLGSGLTAAMGAVAVSSVLWAQADTVHGTVAAGATKVAITSGAAVGYTGANGPLVSVLLSDKPADREAFAADTKTGAGEALVPGLFEGAWKSQHIGRKLSGFTFTLDAKQNILSDEFLVGGRNNTFSLGTGEYVVEVKSTSPRLIGRIRTKTPLVDAGATKAGLDVTFDLAVARPK